MPRSRFALRLAMLLLPLGAADCADPVGPVAPVDAIPTAPRAANGGANRDAVPAASPPARDALAPRPPLATLAVEQAPGADLARARAALAPAEARLAECAPGSSGALVIRITKKSDRTQMSVQPGTQIPSNGRRCALETLSTLNLDGAFEQASPSDRPSGFSAQVRIEW